MSCGLGEEERTRFKKKKKKEKRKRKEKKGKNPMAANSGLVGTRACERGVKGVNCTRARV